MNENKKILQFEYIIHQLIGWYRQVVPNADQMIPSHFTRLASLKLLFFVSAVKDLSNSGHDLLDTFNRYRAMQYGPVEVEVYSAMALQRTQFYKFGNRELQMSSETPDFTQLSDLEKQAVDNAINALRGQNPNIVKLPASRLVDITHKWKSWQNAMSMAEWIGRDFDEMPTETIRADIPYYE